MNFLKKIFGIAIAENYKQHIVDGAIIIDVRNPNEFEQGHINGAINLPLTKLLEKTSLIPKNKTIITCCASGVRSGIAKRILKKGGYNNVINGGGWNSLVKEII